MHSDKYPGLCALLSFIYFLFLNASAKVESRKSIDPNLISHDREGGGFNSRVFGSWFGHQSD